MDSGKVNATVGTDRGSGSRPPFASVDHDARAQEQRPGEPESLRRHERHPAGHREGGHDRQPDRDEAGQSVEVASSLPETSVTTSPPEEVTATSSSLRISSMWSMNSSDSRISYSFLSPR